MDWLNEKNELERLINIEHVSYEEIGRRYNCTGANIKKHAKKLGILIPKRREINPNETFNKGKGKVSHCLFCGEEFIATSKNSKFCSIKCSATYRHLKNYQKVLDGDSSIMRANYCPSKFRDLIMLEQDNQCAICGCEPVHNGKPLVFIVDHVDGKASNNKRSNLRCICPNCDSQLETFKSRNKNGDRSYYRYHKFDDKTKIGK